MQSFRSFRVVLPSGLCYWTVLDDGYRPVAEADDFLLHQRLGLDRAEGTSEAYATALALFLEWCGHLGLSWQQAAAHLGRFVYWLQHYQRDQPHVPAPADQPVRGARRVNSVLAAVREFLRHCVAIGVVDGHVMAALFEVVEDLDLPVEVRGERPLGLRARARHRLTEPESTVDAATDEEVLALIRACRHARDRFIVIALWRTGLRRGELLGLRREDVHFVPDASRLGCRVSGPHLHVVRRENANRAAAKSRRHRAAPADWLTVQAYDQYVTERGRCLEADRCDFLLVNLFAAPLGKPMRRDAINELLDTLSARAGLTRRIRPHMLRHSFGSNVIDAGASLDELKELLGHAWLTSSEVYLHPSAQRLRDVVDRVPSPRLSPTGSAR